MEPAANTDFNTISPSARWLLLLKALTDIPFAREAAKLIVQPEAYKPDYNNQDVTFWARATHFESRYKSVDQLLEAVPVKNILELSSGFSFRGLDKARRDDVYYIDTDLPDLIHTKQALVTSLQSTIQLKGRLELLPLNALDTQTFEAVISRFPPGPVVIVNEGLLMYLNEKEKRQVSANIHAVLQQRGGYWITADIYLKMPVDTPLKISDKLQQFFDQHQMEEKKFASFETAETFFREAGFTLDKEAVVDYSKLSIFPYFMKNIRPEQLEALQKTRHKIQATWRLKTI